MNYQEKYLLWKNSKKLPEYLKKELNKLTKDEIYDAFYTDLEFGTGGLRGIMGVGTNRMNEIVIRKATLGFGNYLLDKVDNCKEKGVVIAHDNRHNSEFFTQVAANTLSSLGIKVYVFDDLRPTPELSFAIRYLHASGGIVITASHNPKEYNGYKIYNSDGCQLILEQSSQVEEEINKINNELDLDLIPNQNLIKVLDKELDERYYEMVLNCSINEVDANNLKIVYTPQHGTGYVPVKTVLNRLNYQLIEVKEQCFPNPDFINTISPNPEEKDAYVLAIKYLKEHNADIILTTDPDCDRVGVVILKNNQPVYLTGNQTGSLLINYILKYRQEKGLLAKNSIIYNTIVTSPLGAKIANKYNVKCEQTLTGFKYIGDKIQKSIENNGPVFQMGYEESYGYLLNSSVRDKDGVQSVMMIAEMAAFYKKQNKDLVDVFEELQQEFGYHIESQYSLKVQGEAGLKKIAQLMNNYRVKPFKKIADDEVFVIEDYLTLNKYFDNKIIKLDYEKSNVLRFIFNDGSFVAIRPSGTEPKCKFYFAVCGKTYQEAKTRHEKVRNFIFEGLK